MVILGNWKMNMVVSNAIAFSKRLREIDIPEDVEIGVLPSYVYLSEVANILEGSRISVGAQDCYYEDQGAFTGEVSPLQLKDLGMKWCLVGHSERRQMFYETDEDTRRKVVSLMRHGINPVLCVGETLAQREAGRMFGIISSQLFRSLERLKLNDEFTIAYEPIWAIGTGITAKPKQVEEATSVIRQIAERMHRNTRFNVLYGGSVNEDNAKNLIINGVDGFLVGGASLSVIRFSKIIDSAR